MRIRTVFSRCLGLALALALSANVFAADTHYLINGVASGKSAPAAGILTPRSTGPARNALGVDHSRSRLGLALVTENIRQGGPLYYSAGSSRSANPPDEPMPKNAAALTPGQLAQKYNIAIIDKPGYLTGPNGEQAVALLDAGLQKYSTEFVRTLVDKWAEKGRFFCINLHYPSASDAFKGATEVDSETICINLAVPAGENPGGVSVNTVSHEFGHAVFLYLENNMGAENLYRQWSALNGPYTYGSRDPNRAHAFISNYGSQYYYEDPATIFEAFTDAPALSVEKLSQKDYAPLLKKAEFLEECVKKYIGTPGTLFSSVWDTMAQKTS